MSVINNVLKDLDSKPSAFTPLDIDTVSEKKRVKKMSPVFWGVAIVIALSMLYMYEFWHIIKPGSEITATETEVQNKQEEAVALSETVISEKTIAASVEASEPMVPGNQIIGLQIRENEEFMELEFQLTQTANSYLKQRSNNRYVFVIRDIQSSIVTPLISDNPWIRQIQLSAVETDMEIRFDTQQGVLVDTQDKREGSANYWLIRLKKSIDVTPVARQENNGVEVNEKSDGSAQLQSQFPEQGSNVSDGLPEPVVKVEIRHLDQQPTSQQILNKAIQSARSGDWVMAKRDFQSLLGGESDRQARVHLLEIFKGQNDDRGFNDLLVETLGQYPNDPVFLLHQANQLFSAKQYLALIDQFKGRADNTQLLSLLATSYQRTEQHQLATQYFIRALKSNPQQPRLWVSLAISQQNLSQRDKALSSYQMALQSGALNSRLQDFVQNKIRQLSN